MEYLVIVLYLLGMRLYYFNLSNTLKLEGIIGKTKKYTFFQKLTVSVFWPLWTIYYSLFLNNQER